MSRRIFLVLPQFSESFKILKEIESSGFVGCESIFKYRSDILQFSLSSGSDTCAVGVPHTVFMTGKRLDKVLEENNVIESHYMKYSHEERDFIENLRLNQQKRFKQDALRWLDLIKKIMTKYVILSIGIYWCYPPKYEIVGESKIALCNLNEESLYTLPLNHLLTILNQ